MAGAKKKPKKKKPAEAEEIGFDRKTIKKVFYGSQMLLGAGAFFILFIMLFISWDFVDKTEKLVKGSADDACDTLKAVEATLIDTSGELDMMDESLDGIEESLTYLSEGLDETADAMRNIDESVNILEPLGVSFGDDFENAAEDMEKASDSLDNTTAGFSVHEQKISEIQNDINDMRVSVSSQKQTLCNQANITEIFDSMRLTVIILFVLTGALIAILFINSAAAIL